MYIHIAKINASLIENFNLEDFLIKNRMKNCMEYQGSYL